MAPKQYDAASDPLPDGKRIEPLAVPESFEGYVKESHLKGLEKGEQKFLILFLNLLPARTEDKQKS